VEQVERDLYAVYQSAAGQLDGSGNVDAFLNAFMPVVPVIQRFFDGVMVNADDPKVRQNRLGLLQALAALAHDRADLSKLAGF
jgi:glycyl-tRNA synthetase beta subunit